MLVLSILHKIHKGHKKLWLQNLVQRKREMAAVQAGITSFLQEEEPQNLVSNREPCSFVPSLFP